MASIVEGIKDLLVLAGVGSFNASSGWSIHIGREPMEPDTCITIASTGGLPSNPAYLLDFPNVQIRVRGRASSYQDAEAKVQEVKDALLGLPSQDLNGDRWVSITQLTDIVHIGFDDNSRPLFTVNLALIIEPATSPLTNRIPL